MNFKAIENLRAAQALLDLQPPCPNGAVSRAYYAVYLAGWSLLERQGDEPPDTDGRRYWRHQDFGVRLLAPRLWTTMSGNSWSICSPSVSRPTTTETRSALMRQGI